MKNKGKYYILMMVGILILTFMVPIIIRAASQAFIGRFAPDAVEEQTEADEDRYRVMEGFTESEESGQIADPGDKHEGGETLSSDDDAAQHEHDPDLAKKELQERKEQTDSSLAAYLEKQDPVFTESRNGMLEAFAGGREGDLTKAVADHLYGTYGSLYDISTIDVVDFIDDDSSELTCQIRVTALIGSKEYSEYYFATYNKVYGFYSIYAYHE